MNKLLSIIIPSYNMEKYLGKCLSSLLVDDRELLSLLDILIVNDGSNDATSAIGHDFANRYPGVFTVIDKTNGHYGSCVNAALKQARGTFVRILDADDTFETVGFERYLSRLQQINTDGNAVDLVLTDVRFVDGEGCQKELVEYPFADGAILTLDDVTGLKKNQIMHAYTYRKSIFNGLDYHQTEGICYTDTEWVFLPITQVKSIVYCHQVVYCYLLGREGQSMDCYVLAKQLDMLRKTVDVRINWYTTRKASWSPAAVRYAEFKLLDECGKIHVMYLQYGFLRFLKEARSLDKTIERDVPSIKGKLDPPYVMFDGKWYGIPYGRWCSNHPSTRMAIGIAFWMRSIYWKMIGKKGL